jgi:FkbM family methyltransferase
MGLIDRAYLALRWRFKRYVLRDPFLREAGRWVRDNGDQTLRLSYPLSSSSVVFDVGGYNGDFAQAIHARYGCIVYLFEPVPEFFRRCVDRFSGNPKIICLNFGLSDADGLVDIRLAENASSFDASVKNSETQKVVLRSVNAVIAELAVEEIALFKINIEGGEYAVLPALVANGDILRVVDLQVQFHDFVAQASSLRQGILEDLARSHSRTWNYTFIWENWHIRPERRLNPQGGGIGSQA